MGNEIDFDSNKIQNFHTNKRMSLIKSFKVFYLLMNAKLFI